MGLLADERGCSKSYGGDRFLRCHAARRRAHLCLGRLSFSGEPNGLKRRSAVALGCAADPCEMSIAPNRQSVDMQELLSGGIDGS